MVTMGAEDLPVMFESRGDAPFDLVAGTFYFLAGWQEKTSRIRDEHGRFLFSESIQSSHNLATVPLVDLFRKLLQKELARLGFQLEQKQWSEKAWAFCPTHDIDYLRKWRPGIFYREIVERALFNSEKETLGARGSRIGSAVAGLVQRQDPYAKTIKRMRDEVAIRGGTATYFFKTAARGPKDVHYNENASFLHRQYLELRSQNFEIGLHPSYHAYNHGRYLREERAALRRATGIDAGSSRTHFLRFDPITTPRLLADTGFQIDSSLGFAEQEGFRRATCLPFPLYDLEADQSLEIWEMPLTLMESTLFNRRHLDGEEAISASEELMATCKRFGGVFVGLWHNLLWDERDFPGWARHFTTCLDHATEEEGLLASLQTALDAWE
ncbi:MAG: hypothetical protein BMS9Abin05_1493 [Rhodothermia bacterium]|nr:MAG: hypothetical protein BMS9Abin05_1493 [Rhodothermia bacterium]